MFVKTRAIVLSAIKYQDKNLIVKCYTKSDGVKSYFIRNVFVTKKAKHKIAYFQSLNILNIEATHKNKGTLEHINDVKLVFNYQNISTNIVKSSIVLFLSEVLHNSIFEEEKNENLYSFIETSLMWLDTHNNISNFHLVFLIQLTKFLGFFPQTTNEEKIYFNMIDGVFTARQGTTCLNDKESKLLKKLINLRFEDTKPSFLREEKQFLLSILLEYYSIHLQGFKKPNSLEILSEIFR